MKKGKVQLKREKRRISIFVMIVMMLVVPISHVFSNPPPPPPGEINSFPIFQINFTPTLEDGTLFLICMGILYLSYKVLHKSTSRHSQEQA